MAGAPLSHVRPLPPPGGRQRSGLALLARHRYLLSQLPRALRSSGSISCQLADDKRCRHHGNCGTGASPGSLRSNSWGLSDVLTEKWPVKVKVHTAVTQRLYRPLAKVWPAPPTTPVHDFLPVEDHLTLVSSVDISEEAPPLAEKGLIPDLSGESQLAQTRFRD